MMANRATCGGASHTMANRMTGETAHGTTGQATGAGRFTGGNCTCCRQTDRH